MQAGRVLLERYKLADRIGEGAMSAVWEAIDQETQESVAVKAVSLDQAGWRAEVRDRFLQEAHLLALVRHEHLVQVRDVGETDDGYLFIILDKLTGETLADRIARAPRIAWREALDIALQIVRGMSALHDRGIVHRDLKPANVFLYKPSPLDAPIAKILDLGISKVRAAATTPVVHATLTATGQVLGTPAYMSYEQALGERDIDGRSDVWAIGVLLYEMLSGKRPFLAPNANAVLAAIRRGPPPSLKELAPGIPAALIAVVVRCLERDRDSRFRDGAELSRALSAVVERDDRSRTARRLRVRVILGASVGLALFVGVGLLLVNVLRQGSASGGGEAAPVIPSASVSSKGTAEPLAPEPSALPLAPPEDKDAGPVDASGSGLTGTTPRATSRPAPSPRKVTRIDDAGF